ncbi:hypothetical protein MHB50_00415 [Siminovitchia sp. FSL H7-0308]|uniref:Uncharacterized protein n=1 Tax=Siminovitchia thermophila TaxID=1245522 RepID=A0ABS2R483_9BACI|nr:hypothetical protein [Siminovitchia thermophila]MBM7714453.1 hypothetical protein [Siminovitchia thermophila]
MILPIDDQDQTGCSGSGSAGEQGNCRINQGNLLLDAICALEDTQEISVY